MSKNEEQIATSRRKANELLTRTKQQDDDRLANRDRSRLAEATKTAKLRELRLAKEAADKLAKVDAKPAKILARKKPAAV